MKKPTKAQKQYAKSHKRTKGQVVRKRDALTRKTTKPATTTTTRKTVKPRIKTTKPKTTTKAARTAPKRKNPNVKVYRITIG